MGKKLKTWGNQSQVDFTTNSNLFSNFLSHCYYDRYVGSTKHLFYYVSCVQDKSRKYPLSIPLIVENSKHS